MTTTRRTSRLAVLVPAVAALCAPPLAAETQWGTNLFIRTVNAWDFAPPTSDITWSIASNQHRYGTNSGDFYAGLDVPDGALILSIALEACDTSAGSQVIGELRRSTTAGVDTLASVATGGAETPGCGRFFMELASPETVDNDNYNYTLVATLPPPTRRRSARCGCSTSSRSVPRRRRRRSTTCPSRTRGFSTSKRS